MNQAKQLPDDFLNGKLSNYPKIVRTLSLLWGSKEIETYFAELFTSSRDQRNGFEPDVFFELTKIQREHQLQFPALQARHPQGSQQRASWQSSGLGCSR
jgi:hypothetical protein